jgi:Ala-tRNA(Pro) deacylase
MSTVAEHLKRRGLSFEQIPHEQAYTSIDEAKALGIAADEVVKTVVLKTASGHALAVVPGARRLNMKIVRRTLGDNHARLASEEDLERAFPGYELGAMPPLGSLFDIAVYVDPEVLGHETIVFAAGTQTESVKIRTADLFRDEQVTVAPLTRETGESEPGPAE